MSIGPMGFIGSLAGGQLAQTKGGDADRVGQETAAQSRETKNAEKAELAAGIGQTTEDAETSDRDADGRRLWEPGADQAERETDEETAGSADRESKAKDPHGDCGVNLDLSG